MIEAQQLKNGLKILTAFGEGECENCLFPQKLLNIDVEFNEINFN